MKRTATVLRTAPICTSRGDPRALGTYGFLGNRDIAATSFFAPNLAVTIPRDAGGGIHPAPMTTLPNFSAWPAAVGSMSRTDSKVKFLVYTDDVD